MPYGGTTPAQDKKIEKCVARVMKTGKSKSSAIAICKAQITKGENMPDTLWCEAVYEAATDEVEGVEIPHIKIKGILQTEGITKNNRRYNLRSRRAKAKTLEGKTIAVDHSQSVRDIIGKYTRGWVDKDKNTRYEGYVFDTPTTPNAIDMVRNKVWEFKSVEVHADKVKYIDEDEDSKTPAYHDISIGEYLGGSFVRWPGDNRAKNETVDSFLESWESNDEVTEDEENTEETTDDISEDTGRWRRKSQNPRQKPRA